MISICPGWVATREDLYIGVAVLCCQTGSFDGERSGGASAPEDKQFSFVFTKTRGDFAFLVEFFHFLI